MIDLEEVKAFAKKKHLGQKRKYGGEDYFIHPLNVGNMVAKLHNDEEMIAAAFLHDTIEDTDTKYEEILEKFGKNIANLVLELTNNEVLKKNMGKVQYLIKKINEMSPKARLIKLLDRLDNVKDLIKADIDFAQYYARNTKKILNNLEITLNDEEREIINKIFDKITPIIKNTE